MSRVLIVGSGRGIGMSIANALRDLSIKVVVTTCEPPVHALHVHDPYIRLSYRYTEQYKREMREQARYHEAGIQQRRKALTKFHQEKRARMAHKQATKRRNRFV